MQSLCACTCLSVRVCASTWARQICLATADIEEEEIFSFFFPARFTFQCLSLKQACDSSSPHVLSIIWKGVNLPKCESLLFIQAQHPSSPGAYWSESLSFALSLSIFLTVYLPILFMEEIVKESGNKRRRSSKFFDLPTTRTSVRTCKQATKEKRKCPNIFTTFFFLYWQQRICLLPNLSWQDFMDNTWRSDKSDWPPLERDRWTFLLVTFQM